jgi:hypothetical protein
VVSIALIVAVVALTSAAACWLGHRWLGVDARSLAAAGWRAAETVGASAIFLAVNIAVGMAVIGAIRAGTGWFMSHYILGDVTLLVLSVLQGTVFTWWHASTRSPESDGTPSRDQR